MIPQRIHTERDAQEAHGPVFDPTAMDFINHLRMIALGCRSAARTDLFEACAILSTDRHVAKTAHAEALMMCLSQALGKAPKMLIPGVVEVSFDEAWLARRSLAARTKDEASLTFLLHSRLPHYACRNIGFLISADSDRISLD